MKPTRTLITALLTTCSLASLCSAQEVKMDWKKHLITQQGHCNTAVAIDANGDKALDVIASFQGRVSFAPLAVLLAADVPKPKPNIIVILADDLGYDGRSRP